MSSSYVVMYQVHCGGKTTKQKMRMAELLLPVVLQVNLQQNKHYWLLAIALLITGNVMKLCGIWEVNVKVKVKVTVQNLTQVRVGTWNQISVTSSWLWSCHLLGLTSMFSCQQKVGKWQVLFSTTKLWLCSKPYQLWMESSAECVTVYLRVLLLMPRILRRLLVQNILLPRHCSECARILHITWNM